MSGMSFGLDYWAVPDVTQCLNEALDNKYHFVVMPIVHPRLRRKASTVPGLSRSDMLLSPEEWATRVVGKLSPYLDVDSTEQSVSRSHEELMVEELNYCQSLSLSTIQITLNSRKPFNLTRILQNHFSQFNRSFLSQIWVKVPMQAEYIANESEEEECAAAHEEPWRWWSRLHEMLEWKNKVGLVLEVSADLPPDAVVRRWLGEPIKALVLPTHLFNTNKKGYPVLSRAHQELVLRFAALDVQVVVSGARRCPLVQYTMYLQHLWDRRPHLASDPMNSYSRGYEDHLQTPLQPLADNLDASTYNVFEKDPVKYRQYQNAIALALLELRRREGKETEPKSDDHSPKENSTDICDGTEGTNQPVDPSEGEGDVPNNSIHNGKVFRIMVLGAGRGPLIRAVFNAADITKSNVEVVAVEKNPCAVVSLAAQAREVWSARRLQLVSGDMRQARGLEPADIIVSELLGSWADNELSPECLDGAAKLLRPGGISIPTWYTSYAAPITCPGLWAAAKAIRTPPYEDRNKNLENLWVVYMKNIHHIAETKPVFTFHHPAKSTTLGPDGEPEDYTDPERQSPPDNRRHATVSWIADQPGVMHGLSGYFDCELYGGEHISIEPSTHSPGMISWFPVYIPIRTPMRFEKGDEIRAMFWRCVSARKVWYEWIVTVGDRTSPLHNVGGRSFEMLL